MHHDHTWDWLRLRRPPRLPRVRTVRRAALAALGGPLPYGGAVTPVERAWRALNPAAEPAACEDYLAWVDQDPGARSLALAIHRRRRAAALVRAGWRESAESEAQGALVRALLGGEAASGEPGL